MDVTVLIVDDSKLARIVAAKAIRSQEPDWQRLEATNASEAIELVDRGGVDVVLVDYNMPGLNGLELAAALRVRRPTMPIAIITANMQDEIVARARELDAVFIAKPLTEDGLSGFLSAARLRLRAGP
jgi:CheY-like chemotaxis protein